MTTYAQPNTSHAAGDDRDGGLRLALKLDAVVSGLFGALLLAGGPVIDDLLGARLALLWSVGLFTVAYGVVVWSVASPAESSRRAVESVMVGNLVWVAGSVAVVAAGWLSLTALGTAFVLAQAATVALLAGLQFFGLRRG